MKRGNQKVQLDVSFGTILKVGLGLALVQIIVALGAVGATLATPLVYGYLSGMLGQ